MALDIEFFLALGKYISLVVCVVFIEGVVASRIKGTWTGILLPVALTLVSFIIFGIWKNGVYFFMVFGPALLSWFIYYMCRRSIRNGTALTLMEEEE